MIKTQGHCFNSIHSVGIILKPHSSEIKSTYQKVKDSFESNNINVLLEEKSALMIGEKGVGFDTLCQRVTFLVSIGGDGTLISVARRSCVYNKAVLGIHLGTLGFLTDLMLDELSGFIEQLLKGEYKIDQRMMLKGLFLDQEYIGFNDIVISKKTVSTMVRLNATIDGKLFNSYYGDGLIISTPTGSTAYNLSVGGPLVHPLSDAIILTPIAPHSLTQRPLVLPSHFIIELTILDEEGAMLIIDGQDGYEMNYGDTIYISVSTYKAQLIQKVQRNYFEVLHNKLQWGT